MGSYGREVHQVLLSNSETQGGFAYSAKILMTTTERKHFWGN